MLDHANGEVDPDRPEDLPAVWSAVDPKLDIAMGGEHSEFCERGDDSDCECERIEFSTSRCEGCGDSHHGSRYAFTLFVREAA
jgi:hypothetical protein